MGCRRSFSLASDSANRPEPEKSSSLSSSSPAFLTYWALSSDPAAIQDSSHAVASMAVNASGIYLLADNGRDTVYRLLFPSPPASKGDSRVLKVDPSGRLRALTLTAGAAVNLLTPHSLPL